jgi:hypothetical protein
MKRIRSVLVAVVVPVFMAGLAWGQTPTAAPGSFAWKGEEAPFKGGADSVKASLHAVVDARLAELGCSVADRVSPDLFVVGHLARRDPEAPISGLAALVIDLVDAATGKLIWRSFDSDLSAAALAGASVARGKTYNWHEVPGKPGVEQSFTRVDRHVRNAMEAVMLFRDWTVASDPATADVYIAYRVTAQAGADKQPTVATLTIELTRRGSSKVLWRGERTMNVPKPSDLEDSVINSVVEIAADYRDGKPSTAQ